MKRDVYEQHEKLEDIHWWFVARRQILLPLIHAAMSGFEDDLIVDIGCGTGGTVSALSENYNCMGIDHSQQAIDAAKSKYTGCNFIRGSMPEDLGATSENTGLYLLMDVLEHIEEDAEFLAEVSTLTRPGGHILITVPAKPALWSEHDISAGHVRRYEMNTLSKLWESLPLEPRVISYFNTRLYPVIWAIRMIVRHVPFLGSQSGSDFSMPSAVLNDLLTKIFAQERHRIERLLHQPDAKPYSKGVSLVALLQKPS